MSRLLGDVLARLVGRQRQQAASREPDPELDEVRRRQERLLAALRDLEEHPRIVALMQQREVSVRRSVKE